MLVGLVAALATVLKCLIVALAPALQATRIAWKHAGSAATRSGRMPLSRSINGTLQNAIVGGAVAGGLGVIALLLAVIGVFGVFSYLIEERRLDHRLRQYLDFSADLNGGGHAPRHGEVRIDDRLCARHNLAECRRAAGD